MEGRVASLNNHVPIHILMEGSHRGLKAVNKWVVAPKRASVSTLEEGACDKYSQGLWGKCETCGKLRRSHLSSTPRRLVKWKDKLHELKVNRDLQTKVVRTRHRRCFSANDAVEAGYSIQQTHSQRLQQWRRLIATKKEGPDETNRRHLKHTAVVSHKQTDEISKTRQLPAGEGDADQNSLIEDTVAKIRQKVAAHAQILREMAREGLGKFNPGAHAAVISVPGRAIASSFHFKPFSSIEQQQGNNVLPFSIIFNYLWVDKCNTCSRFAG
jgi:hypothetical protein